MLNANVELQEELEAVYLERQMLEEQNIVFNDELRQLKSELRSVNRQNESLEEKVHEQQKLIISKDEALTSMKDREVDAAQISKGDKTESQVGEALKMIKIDDHKEVLEQVIQYKKDLDELQEKLDKYETLYQNSDFRHKQTLELTKKQEFDLAKLKDMNTKLNEKILIYKENEEELQIRCEVAEEEYNNVKVQLSNNQAINFRNRESMIRRSTVNSGGSFLQGNLRGSMARNDF